MSTAAVQPVTYGRDSAIATFSVARYQQMIEAGILTSEDKVELLENYVVLKMPRNPEHDGTIQLVQENLAPVIPSAWRLRVQLTVVFSDSQPEPDFAVVRGDARAFLNRHPTPADVGLLIEVANASLLRDQRDKTRIYARGGIPYYWIVNLDDRQIEVYSQPAAQAQTPSFGDLKIYKPGDGVPLLLDAAVVAAIPAADMLP